MEKIKSKLILLVIILLGLFIYLYKLSNIPNALYIDEIMPSYSAYSILTTGKDEYGKFMPIVFRFFGSYNPSLYTYLTVVPIYLFGLNHFSARFISVLAGLLSSIVIFVFLSDSKIIKNYWTKFFGTAMFIITPWIFFYSRIGYEVTLGYLLFSLGALLIYKSLENKKYLILGLLSLSLSTYAAYAERFLAPLLIVTFFITFHKRINFKYFASCLIVVLISQIPNIYILFSPAFFPKDTLWSSSNGSFIREFLSKFFTYFSPGSLFFLPDPDKQRSIPELSVFYMWMIVPYFVGAYQLWINKKEDLMKMIFILAVICSIPAALTRDPFSTHRALPLLLPLFLTIGLGIDFIFEKLKSSLIVLFTAIVLILISLFSLWRGYFVLLPSERARDWGYGYKELSEQISSKSDKHFIIDQSRSKPAYIYLLYYLKFSPSDFQNVVDKNVLPKYYENTPFKSDYKINNVETRNIRWETDMCRNYVLVGDEYAISESQAIEHGLSFLFEINDPVGNIIFKGYQVDGKSTKDCNIKYEK